jgi:Outer membrane protein beta-barrel domain
MKKIILFFVSFVLIISAEAQITKGNWLVGGSVSFLATKNTGIDPNSVSFKQSSLTIHPDFGYFFFDKFAGGIGVLCSVEHLAFGSSKSNSSYSSIGPFVRYYFLPVEKQVNLFSEASYQYMITSSQSQSQRSGSFNIGLGAEVYLNRSVGIELSLTHTYSKTKTTTQQSILIGLGFQIHLEKDDN